MNSGNKLLIIGDAAASAAALTIAKLSQRYDDVSAVDLPASGIAALDVSSLDVSPDRFQVFAAIGNSALNFARYDLWGKFKIAGFRFATLIHPAAYADSEAALGDNVLIGAGAIVESAVSVGTGTTVGARALIAGGSTIGPWCWLGNGVVVGAGSSIGSHCVLGTGVRLSDRTSVGKACELDSSEIFRGAYPDGTFITPEFASPGARLMRSR